MLIDGKAVIIIISQTMWKTYYSSHTTCNSSFARALFPKERLAVMTVMYDVILVADQSCLCCLAPELLPPLMNFVSVSCELS